MGGHEGFGFILVLLGHWWVKSIKSDEIPLYKVKWQLFFFEKKKVDNFIHWIYVFIRVSLSFDYFEEKNFHESCCFFLEEENYSQLNEKLHLASVSTQRKKFHLHIFFQVFHCTMKVGIWPLSLESKIFSYRGKIALPCKQPNMLLQNI